MVFDDTKPWPEKLTLFQDQMQLNGEYFLTDRASPINLPLTEAEPLKAEMRAFIQSCEDNGPTPTDINEAVAVQHEHSATLKNNLIDTSLKSKRSG